MKRHHLKKAERIEEIPKSIIKGNRRNIEDRKKLLEMLTANVVLEYNSERWRNVHPLVKDYLVRTGFLD